MKGPLKAILKIYQNCSKEAYVFVVKVLEHSQSMICVRNVIFHHLK